VSQTFQCGNTGTTNIDTNLGCIIQTDFVVTCSVTASGFYPLCVKLSGEFRIDTGGTLDISGTAGTDGGDPSPSAGGGGGGGALYVTANSVNIVGTLNANGGNGGKMGSGNGAEVPGGPGGGRGGKGENHPLAAGVVAATAGRCAQGMCGENGGLVTGGQGGGVGGGTYGAGGGGGGNLAAGTAGAPCPSPYEGAAGIINTGTELIGGGGGGGGGDDTDNEEGGGGGGAGGTVWLVAPTIQITGTVTVTAGTGGNGDSGCNGGAGSLGVIAYTGSKTGGPSTMQQVAADWKTVPEPTPGGTIPNETMPTFAQT